MAYLTRQEEQVLMAVLNLEDKAYLVTIREQIKQFTGKSYSLGTIYVPLNRLEKKGYLDSFLGEPTGLRGGKAVKYYRITKQGLAALDKIRTLHHRMWENFSLSLKKK
jgi:DNA-binding PadR family transcriptional regulator